MHSLRDAPSIAAFLEATPDPELHQLISERMAELAAYDDYDISELVNFLVVEPGDSLAAVSEEIGLGLGDGSKHWDSFITHPSWHEVVYVLSDDGFGFVIYIPAEGLADPALSDLCARAASEELAP